MISIKNLHKSFGKQKVLKDLSTEIKPGIISAVLGPNGSGKSTILKCILGMVIPDKGEILVNGTSIQNKWDYRKEIGYLPQIARFPDNLKVKELIAMIQDLREEEGNSHELVNFFELQSFMDKALRNLSGGTRQKINVVLTFMFDNPIVIMDEPTAGLDPIALIRLKEMIVAFRNQGKTILFTTHIMSLVEELSDEIIFLLEGKIYFQGSLDEMKSMTGEISLERSIAGILESGGDIDDKKRIVHMARSQS